MKKVEIVGFGPKLGGRKVTAQVVSHDAVSLIARDRDGTVYKFRPRDAGVELNSVGKPSGWKLAPAYARQMADDTAKHEEAREKAAKRAALLGGCGTTERPIRPERPLATGHTEPQARQPQAPQVGRPQAPQARKNFS